MSTTVKDIEFDGLISPKEQKKNTPWHLWHLEECHTFFEIICVYINKGLVL